MDAKETRAGEHEISYNKFADGEEDGDEDVVGSGWLLIPARTTIRELLSGLNASAEQRDVHHRRH